MSRIPPSRRDALRVASGLILTAAAPQACITPRSDLFAELERRSGGRLGVAVIDTGGDAQIGHRMRERFGMCSTFKLPLAAMILREVDQGRLSHDQVVPYSRADMVPYAPVAERHLANGGMTVRALAEAIQVHSDNVAANLLLRLIGGPADFTYVLRSLGDAETRLDRIEPEMNFVPEGEVRDTTTPQAMAQTIKRMLTTNFLTPASRDMLIAWMMATNTGARRLRAGLPAGWRAGDKTGTALAPGMNDKYNDVAIVWPPDKAPVVIAAYLEAAGASDTMRDEDQAVLAEVGRIAAAWALRRA